VIGGTYIELIDSLGAQRQLSDHNLTTTMLSVYKDSQDSERKKFAAFYLAVSSIEAEPGKALEFLKTAQLLTKDADPLHPVIDFYRAKALINSGNIKAAHLRLRELFDSEKLGSAWLQNASESFLQVLFKEDLSEEFIAVYEKYTEKTASQVRSEAVVQLAAQVFRKMKMRAEQIASLEELAVRYPTSEGSRWAFHNLLEMSCTDVVENRYYFSYKLLTSLGRNASLGNGLEQFLLAVLDQEITDQEGTVKRLSEIDKIQFLFDARIYSLAFELAKKAFEDVKHEQSNDHRRVALLLARIGTRLRDFDSSVRYFTYFPFKFPTYFDRSRILEFIADALRFSGNYSGAEKEYRMLAESNPSKELKWHHFWTSFRSGNNREAMRLLTKEGYVTARDATAPGARDYWQGRVYERINEGAKAQKLFAEVLRNSGDGFYSTLVLAKYPALKNVAELLGESKDGKEINGGFVPLPPTDVDRYSMNAEISKDIDPHLNLILELLNLNLNESAQMELRSLNRKRGADPIEMALRDEIARRVDDYHINRRGTYIPLAAFLSQTTTSWRAMARHQTDNKVFWKAFYPLPYRHIVTGVSERLAIDPYLVWSLMRAESEYNPNAVSPVGARGLLQVMPYTAVKIAQRLSGVEFKAEDLLKPEYNIGMGAWYIKRLMNYYSDNIILAIAAYNAGPQAVNAWLDRCASCQIDEFIESIPFDETRGYVKKVLTSYSRYHRIYEQNFIFSALPKIPDDRPVTDEAF
jgi:soluble lytic murein transglycosylase-like protein